MKRLSIRATMKPLRLARKRSAGPLASNIYLFFGEEDLLIEEKINQLKKQISNLKVLKKEKIPIKYYSLNVFNEDPKLLEPIKWLIKEILT